MAGLLPQRLYETAATRDKHMAIYRVRQATDWAEEEGLIVEGLPDSAVLRMWATAHPDRVTVGLTLPGCCNAPSASCGIAILRGERAPGGLTIGRSQAADVAGVRMSPADLLRNFVHEHIGETPLPLLSRRPAGPPALAAVLPLAPNSRSIEASRSI